MVAGKNHIGQPADVNGTEVAFQIKKTTIVDRQLSYRFHTHFHPYVNELVHELIERSVRGLQEADTQYVRTPDGAVVTLPDGKPRPVLYEELFTVDQYAPSDLVIGTTDEPYPVKDLDFSSGGAYSVYNWELFYHIPISIAVHLSRNQQFEEAQRWFHHVFDPTDSSSGPTPQRFWRVKPFQTTDVKMIEEVLTNLATGADPTLQKDTINSIGAWKDNPFRPHQVARFRQSAYMLKAVMAYLDNLIDWGDALFREDTGESINEATQIYVLAANILGTRPQEAPRKGFQRAQTYSSLRADLDAFSNAMREVEADIPFDLSPAPPPAGNEAELGVLRSLGSALYFCVPRNDKLLAYWDTVADRLFKIRNSLNIQGVFRQLPLFEPPIDPALLAKAAAAGLDVASIVSGVNQPLPLVRFSLLVSKALEICEQVTSLGSLLLSAIEKEDAEALAALRAKQDRILLGLGEAVKYQQLQEAIKNREGLERSLTSAVARYTYYERLLGKKEGEIKVPELDALDTEALAKMKFKSDEPDLARRPIDINIATGVLEEAKGRKLSALEADELKLLKMAQGTQTIAGVADALSGTLGFFPNFEVSAEPFGIGGSFTFGGSNMASAFSGQAAAARSVSAELSYQASQSAKIGSYERREQEWAFQSNSAAGEIAQTYKQLRAAQIREAMAEREWKNHQTQIEHAEEIERFLTDAKTGKTSSQALYSWMRREVRGLYAQCFQLAFEVAKKAERALAHELGEVSQTFLQVGYMSGKQGLLAGEKLRLDLKRMELAYHDLNQREYELVKHVSLLQLDPRALLALRETGSATVTLPECLFDLDCPGHYFRRIKSVAVSIPAVVGPYTSVNCTLTLLKSSIRKSPEVDPKGYERDGEDSAHFSDHFGSVQSIVTSSASNDAGLFEVNLRDERYLPFEGAGAISEWRLDLPADLPQFDHSTISDVILHVRYTAREGGAPLRTSAVAALTARIQAATAAGSVRLLSVRREFPVEWARFKAINLDQQDGPAELAFTLREEHYPFWAKALGAIDLGAVTLYAEPGLNPPTSIKVYDTADPLEEPPEPPITTYDELTPDPSLGGVLAGKLSVVSVGATGPANLYFDDNSMRDLWIALTWKNP